MASLFGGKEPQVVPPPVIAPPPVMPTPDDEATRRAKRRSLASQYGRRGRSSTRLSEGAESETLGG